MTQQILREISPPLIKLKNHRAGDVEATHLAHLPSNKYPMKTHFSILFFLLLAAFSTLSAATTEAPTFLTIELTTGNDDLRGGKDNFNVVVLYNNGRRETLRNLNQGRRLADRTTRTWTKTISGSAHSVRGINIETTASGGFSGDNWNVDRLKVSLRGPGFSRTVLTKSGKPLVRFTGDNRVEEFIWGSSAPASAPAKMTRFSPRTHGFNFANDFVNKIVFDVEMNGLCGGMVYSALDYYNARQRIPRTTALPRNGSSLHGYIFRRQMNSVGDNADKWGELIATNFGNRDREFFNWGLQAGSGRLGELTAMIDRGQPVPLGLQTTGKGPFSHQVLAIGYKLGRYQGDLGEYQTDVEIYVYDPNYPNVITTIKADPRRMCYYIKGKSHKYWRTYFVDRKYRNNRPAAR